MQFTIITLYPDLIKPYLDGSILGRAQKNGAIDIKIINLRDFGLGKYKQVDDTPYGGGPGMILKADVVVPAIHKSKIINRKSTIVLLSPSGKQFGQSTATRYSKLDHIVLVCGRFEGFDERIKKYCDEVISVGPYVLSGGELAALSIVESTARLLPGVLGNELSANDESFVDNMVEYPQFTKPMEYDNMNVPSVLLGGNHADIAKWRQARKRKI